MVVLRIRWAVRILTPIRILMLALLVFGAHATAGAPTPVAADEDEAEESRTASLRGLAAYGLRDLRLRLGASRSTPKRLQSIEASLAWLAAHQSPSGAWEAFGFANWCDGKQVKDEKAKPNGQGSDKFDVGVTGLVISAFHAGGHTHLDGSAYGRVIARGLKYLSGVQDAEGCVGARASKHYVYNHAYASQALVEAYAITGDGRLRSIAQHCIDFIRLSQNPYFGWRYGVKPSDNDTSVTTAMCMPLLTAWHLNNVAAAHGETPPLEVRQSMFDGAMRWFKAVIDPRTGRAGYTTRGTPTARPASLVDTFPGDLSEAMTAAVLAVRNFTPPAMVDESDWHEINARSTQLLLALPPRWSPRTGHIDFYYWYYGTTALEKVGGSAFDAWDKELERALTKFQRMDTTSCEYRGSWDPIGPWSLDGGRVYTTAVCTIALCAPGRLTPRVPTAADVAAHLESEGLGASRLAWLLEIAAFHEMAALAPRAGELIGHKDPAVRRAAARVAFMGDLRKIPEGKLLEHLKNPSTDVRLTVLAALREGGHLSPAIATQVGALLDHEDATIRRAASGALSTAQQLPEALAPAMIARLQDSDGRLRMRVAGALVRMGKGEAAIAVIKDGLDSRAAMVRAEAARATALLESLPEELIGATREAAQSAAHSIRTPAALALYRGSPADRTPALAGHLLTGLAQADADLRRELLKTLAEVEPAHARAQWKALTPWLQAGREESRLSALRAIVHVAPADEGLSYLFLAMANPSPIISDAARAAIEARPESKSKIALLLAPTLRSNDARLRQAAWDGMAYLGEHGISVLADSLRKSDPATVVRALLVARRLGPTAEVLSPEVMRLMRESKIQAIVEAAMATLVRIAPCDRATVEALIAIARKHVPQRDGAMAALAVLAEDRTGRIAKEALHEIAEKEPDKLLRVAAIKQLDASNRSVAKRLFEFLGSPTSEVVAAAIQRLGAAGTTVVRPALRILKGKDTQRYAGAMRVLQMVGPEASRATRTLMKFYEDQHDPLRWVAADALVAIGEDSVRYLLDYAKKADEQNQIWTINLLGRIGPQATRATSWLEKTRKTTNPKLAEAAQQALARIQSGN